MTEIMLSEKCEKSHMQSENEQLKKDLAFEKQRNATLIKRQNSALFSTTELISRQFRKEKT